MKITRTIDQFQLEFPTEMAKVQVINRKGLSLRMFKNRRLLGVPLELHRVSMVYRRGVCASRILSKLTKLTKRKQKPKPDKVEVEG